MIMKKILPVCLALLTVTLLVTALFSSCRKKENFRKVDVTTTTAPVTEPVTYFYSELEIVGTRMGMSLEETQQALGVPIAIRTNESGIVYFPTPRKGMEFINPETEIGVYFIFDENIRLCELQYAPTAEMGFDLNTAIDTFNGRFGRHAEVSGEGKTNYVWYGSGDYIVLTAFADGQNAVSYFSRPYFERTQADLAEAYGTPG